MCLYVQIYNNKYFKFFSFKNARPLPSTTLIIRALLFKWQSPLSQYWSWLNENIDFLSWCAVPNLVPGESCKTILQSFYLFLRRICVNLFLMENTSADFILLSPTIAMPNAMCSCLVLMKYADFWHETSIYAVL